MGMKVLATSAVLVSLAGGAMAQALDPVRVEMFRSILAGNECTLTEAAAANILPRFDFTRDETRSIVGALVAAGEVQLDGNTLMLVDGSCAADDPVADLLGRRDVQQFIAVMAEHGCAMTEDEGERIFPERGMDQAQVGAVVGPMIQVGMASFEAGILSVDSAYCTAPVVAAEAAPVVEAPVTEPTSTATASEDESSPRGRFMAAVIGNGCALEVSTAESYLADEAGLRMDQAFRIVDDLVAEGEATLISSGTVVQVDLALCGETGTALVVEQANPVEAPIVMPVEAPITPVANSDDPRAGLLAMLAANNCEITQANAAELIAGAGLDFNTSMQMLTQMMGAGEATSPDGGQTLNVNAPLCVATAAEPMTPRDAFINLIKQNNCSITAAEFSAQLPVNGLDANTAFGMIGELEAEGVISLPATRDVVTLSAEMCR